MGYRPEIDGLRAIAVLSVIFCHAGIELMRGGFVGVDVFFVISGYLIASIIIAEKEAGVFSFARFYERRVRRIAPALCAVLLLCAPFAWLWMLPHDMKEFSKGMVATVLFVSNILFANTGGYFDDASELNPLIHTWSLAVEEQYYLLFPAFLIFTWRLGRRWVVSLIAITATVSLAVATHDAATGANAAFYLFHTRVWELLIGVLLAFRFNAVKPSAPDRAVNELSGVLGLAMIVYAVLAFDQYTPFPGLYAVVPVIGAGLIIQCATQATLVGRCLGSRALVGIGLISYSAYLWHQPLLAFARLRSIGEPAQATMSLMAVLTLLLAYLSWRYIETPFRRRQDVGAREVFAASATAGVAILLFGLIGYFQDGYTGRVAREIVELSEMKAAYMAKRYGGRCNAVQGQAQLSKCVVGDRMVPPALALWGDSHAVALLDALRESLPGGVSMLQLTKDACPPALNVKDKPGWKCEVFSKHAFDEILRAESVETVILAARWQWYVEASGFNNGEGGLERSSIVVADIRDDWSLTQEHKARVASNYAHTVRALLAAGKKVVLVYPIPEVGWRVPDRLAKQLLFKMDLDEENLSTNIGAYVERTRRTRSALDAIGEHERLFRVDPKMIFCDAFLKDRCVAQLRGKPLYYDDDHLTIDGARLVSQEIAKYIQ